MQLLELALLDFYQRHNGSDTRERFAGRFPPAGATSWKEEA
jgi:hypothetical protein